MGAVYLTNWPGFILLGPTKSGKTLLGWLAARRFGIDPGTAIVMLMRETEGSLLGRRVQTGPATWEITPSPFLALPLIVLDEFDKASPELRGAAFAYLAGESRYRSEGTELHVGPTAIVTLNDDGGLAKLPDAYLRRSIVLDTAPLGEATVNLDVTAHRLAQATIPTLPPGLAPPAPDLTEEARHGLRLLLRTCLTTRGWALVDVEAISRLVLGRWAQEPNLEAAVLAVAADYLLVTATRPGLVAPDWPLRFENVSGRSDGPIAATLAAARERQAAGEARQVSEEQLTRAASLELAGTRARLLGELDRAVRTTPRTDLTDEERATIDTAHGKAHHLRAEIAGARSSAALLVLEEDLGRDVLTPIRTVVAARETRRQQATEEQERARQRAADATRRTKAQAQAERESRAAARQAATARHAELQAFYRRERTDPAEDVITALLTARCLARRSEQYEVETWRSMLARGGHRVQSVLHGPVASPPPRMAPLSSWPAAPPARPVSSEPAPVYTTKTEIWYEDRAGHRCQLGELVTWGSEPVRAVIAAAAVAEGLPKLTLPASRRREPTGRASPSSSRRPS